MQTTVMPMNRRLFQLGLLGTLAMATARTSQGWMPVPTPAVAYDDLVAANNAFALALLKLIENQDEGKNHFFSPFSMQAALLMTLEGARSETASQMGTALRIAEGLKTNDPTLPLQMAKIRQQYASAAKLFAKQDTAAANSKRSELKTLRAQLAKANAAAVAAAQANQYREIQKQSQSANVLADRINELAKQVDQFELDCANSLWIDKSYPLSSSFEKIIHQYYAPSESISVDFRGNAEAERLRINAWVSKHTKDKIKDLIPQGAVSAITRLVLANAIYFKGSWSSPFAEAQTKNASFTNSSGSKSSVSMMSQQRFEAGKYAAFQSDGSLFGTPTMVDEGFDQRQGYPTEGGFLAAELPYNGDALSMLVLLPTEPTGLEKMVRAMTQEKLKFVSDSMASRAFHCYLPKFKLTSEYKLKQLLSDMGMPTAFSNSADFSGLTESEDPQNRLCISEVVHKAFVEVNEKGTEAAAATAVLMAPTSAAPIRQIPFVPTFRADHPFLFVIQEKRTGMVLFMGKVETPSI